MWCLDSSVPEDVPRCSASTLALLASFINSGEVGGIVQKALGGWHVMFSYRLKSTKKITYDNN